MEYKIPIGTKIIPYSLKNDIKGITRLSTIEVIFENIDIIKTAKFIDADTKELVEGYCLSLGDNESKYDSFIVNVKDVESDTLFD